MTITDTSHAISVTPCATCRHDRTGPRATTAGDTCASRDQAGRPWYVSITSGQPCGGWERDTTCRR